MAYNMSEGEDVPILKKRKAETRKESPNRTSKGYSIWSPKASTIGATKGSPKNVTKGSPKASKKSLKTKTGNVR